MPVSAGPWKTALQPLRIGTLAGPCRFIEVLDARGDLVCRVQVDEDDEEQQANLEAILRIGDAKCEN